MNDLAILTHAARQQANRYYGKYRGLVVDNADPEQRGRCRVTVPSVMGDAVTDWAQPVTAYGGKQDIGFIAVPPVDAMVVVEFLEGDISSPVWTGTLWRAAGEPPKEFAAAEPTRKVLKTEAGHILAFEDKAGSESVTLKSKAGAQAELDADGTLALTDGKGATVRLDAKAGEIRIADANGNSMVMAAGGVTVSDSAGNSIATSASGIKVAGAMIEIKGQGVVLGGAGGEPLVKGFSFMALFNSHMHVSSAPGLPTSPPTMPVTPGVLTKATVAS